MKTSATTLGWLVMAAARKAMGGAMLAAALVLGTTACSSDDTIAEEPTPQQPANPAVTADGKVHVTVGAGIGDDGQTRSAVVETEYYDEDENEKTRRTLTFTLPVGEQGDANYSPGDRLYIIGDITPNVRRMFGMLTIKSVSDDGLSATFEGDLTIKVKDDGTWKVDETGWAAEQTGDPMTWYGDNGIMSMLIHAATAADAPIYTFYDDGGIIFNYDYSLVTGDGDLVNKLMESAINVNGSYDKSGGRFTLGCSDAIFNCTISGLAKNTSYHVRSTKNNMYIPYNQTVNTDGDGTARFAISSNLISGNDEKFLLLSPDDNFFSENPNLLSCSLGNRNFTSKVYNLSRYWNGTAFVASRTINLDDVTASNLPKDDDGNAILMLRNGDVLTGTLDGSKEEGKVKIEIDDGATVTLNDAHINGHHYSDTECLWAGITCLGDATIVLSGENTVTNFNRNYPAILAAHNDTGSGSEYTLTISGTGKLTATGYGFGAGIGGGDGMACGNIKITGGTITANGGSSSAAIGGGSGASCGSITISGGTVTAKGGERAAGIGSGYCGGIGASCGDITISGTATVTATAGGNAAGIGSGSAEEDSANTCGSISISGPCTVIATGGKEAAGIGTGNYATCGSISITGGTVTAKGGERAAGIGCGTGESVKSECGDITIADYENDFNRVTAIKGNGAFRPIGHFDKETDNNTCGTIKFGGHAIYTAGGDPNDYYTGDSGMKFMETTTDLGGGEDYTNNTWVLWR